MELLVFQLLLALTSILLAKLVLEFSSDVGDWVHSNSANIKIYDCLFIKTFFNNTGRVDLMIIDSNTSISVENSSFISNSSDTGVLLLMTRSVGCIQVEITRTVFQATLAKRSRWSSDYNIQMLCTYRTHYITQYNICQ